MKTKIEFKMALITSMSFMLMGMQAKAQGKAVLTVNVPAKVNGQKAYLKAASAPYNTLDSGVVTNGKVTLTGDVAFPQLCDVTINKPEPKNRYHYSLPVFVESGNIKVSAPLDSNMTDLEEETNLTYPYEKVKVSGSKTDAEFRKFEAVYAPLTKSFMDSFWAYIKYLNPGKDMPKGSIADGIKFATAHDVSEGKVTACALAYLLKYPSSYVSLYVASTNFSYFDAKQLDQVIATLSPDLYKTILGEKTKARLERYRRTAVGAKFVDLDLKDIKGAPVKLSDYAGKGKYLMIDFWASWCHPCRADIPHLKEAYELYHPAGFEVLSVSMDSSQEKWQKAVDEEQMPWAQISDLKAFTGQLPRIYNFGGIPTCLLIGPDGTIVSRNMRESWMDRKLIELYGNKFSE